MNAQPTPSPPHAPTPPESVLPSRPSPSPSSEARAKVRVAIAGVGNCASSLLQGIEHYREQAPEAQDSWGLMHLDMGGYTTTAVANVEAILLASLAERVLPGPAPAPLRCLVRRGPLEMAQAAMELTGRAAARRTRTRGTRRGRRELCGRRYRRGG